jgi:GntR family transcriptional regulator
MHFQLDFKSGRPAYLQIVQQVKYAAASGALLPGEPLPSIRPLAEELRINRNTVAKAYAELEGEGIIETRPGKGSVLAENHSPLRKRVRQQRVLEAIDEAIVQAHHLQISSAEFRELVEQRLERFRSDADTHHSPEKG